jgi:putative tricarboxylic transport membrane protein
MRRINIIASTVLLLLAGYSVYVARQMPDDISKLGAGFFPELVGGLLAAFAVCMLYFAIKGEGRDQEAPQKPQKSLLISLACLLIYVGLMPYVGFIVTTPVFLVVTGLAMADSARLWWKKLCLSAAITTAAVYYLFAVMLNVPLP